MSKYANPMGSNREIVGSQKCQAVRVFDRIRQPSLECVDDDVRPIGRNEARDEVVALGPPGRGTPSRSAELMNRSSAGFGNFLDPGFPTGACATRAARVARESPWRHRRE